MALDGIYLSHICREINGAKGCKIEKVYQPSGDEFVFVLRGRDFNKKLLVSAGGAAPRIHFTTAEFENPIKPPMLCMLVRKYFVSAKLENVTQNGLDRVVRMDFSAYNELGDLIQLSVILELMGRQSNIIFLQSDKVIDAVRRISPEQSERMILPGAKYVLPPRQDKCDVRTQDAMERIKSDTAEISKRLMRAVEGISPIVARELTFLACGETDCTELNSYRAEKLASALEKLRGYCNDGDPVIVYDLSGKSVDFSFMPITQYGDSARTEHVGGYSTLLDRFYEERAQKETMRRKSHDMMTLLTRTAERISRKIEKQRGELAGCADKEKLRVYGELLKANLYRIARGCEYAEVENYYDNNAVVRIPLKSDLTPALNAQKYFKDYKKAHTAEQMLTKLIDEEIEELDYLDSVFDAISRATSERELGEIRAELVDEGYIIERCKKQRPPKALPPLHFISSDGFDIFVGRNNRQNDELTLRFAGKRDIWLHTKGEHGSHAIIRTDGDVSDTAITEAAALAAYYSKARLSSQVAVDYCPVKNVRKPSGARPGMVIYDTYRTVYVTPNGEICKQI